MEHSYSNEFCLNCDAAYRSYGRIIKPPEEVAISTPTNENELDRILIELTIPDRPFERISHPSLAKHMQKPELAKAKLALRKHELQTVRDVLNQLLDAQDQEVDPDGRPLYEPYYIIGGDGERYLIEELIRSIEKELREELSA